MAKATTTAGRMERAPSGNPSLKKANLFSVVSAGVSGGIRQGKAEAGLDNGIGYDDLADAILALEPGQAIVLEKGTHFGKRMSGNPLSVSQNLRQALTNAAKRGDHVLTRQQFRCTPIVAGQTILTGGRVADNDAVEFARLEEIEA